MSYSLSLFTNSQYLVSQVGTSTQISKAQADNGSYTGNATVFYRLDIPHTVYKASDLPKYSFKTSILNLTNSRHKINIKATGRYVDSDIPAKLHITVYEYVLKSVWEPIDINMPAYDKVIEFGKDFKTFDITTYVPGGNYVFFIYPEYANTTKTYNEEMHIIFDDFLITTELQTTPIVKDLDNYYIDDIYSDWVPLVDDNSHTIPYKTNKTLSESSMTHPYNTTKCTTLAVHSCKKAASEIPAGYTLYFLEPGLTTYYIRFLAKFKYSRNTPIRVTLSRIDASWSVGSDEWTVDELKAISNVNDLYVEEVLIDEYIYPYSSFKFVNFRFEKKYSLAQNYVYALSIGAHGDYSAAYEEIEINSFMIYTSKDITSGNFDPIGYNILNLGKYNNPITANFGIIDYTVISEYSNTRDYFFKAFDGAKPPSDSFIYIDDEYYKIKDSFSRKLYRDEKTLAPNSTSDYIYFKSDGKMARNEYLLVDGAMAYADDDGILEYKKGFVHRIEPELTEIQLLQGESIDIIANIIYAGEKRDTPITLSVESTDEEIFNVTNIDPGIDSNKIYLSSYKVGIANLRLSYMNEDSILTIVSVLVNVMDPLIYQDFDIKVLNNLNYLTVGQTTTLYLMKTVANPIDLEYEWSSSDDSIVSVTSGGVITAKKLGTATITASNDLLGKSASCTVHVVDRLYEGKHLTFTNLDPDPPSIYSYTRYEGDIFNIEYVVTYKSGTTTKQETSQKVYWSSDNPSVATINNYGVVTCLKPGIVEFECTPEAAVGETSRYVGLEVKEKTGVLQNLSLNLTETTLNKYYSNDTKTLKVSFEPENTTETGVYWSSSNPDIVTVNQSGTITPGILTGEATITCSSTFDKSIFATCKVTVVNQRDYCYVNLNPTEVKSFINNNITINVDRPGYRLNSTYKVNVTKNGVTSSHHTLNTYNTYLTVSFDEIGTYKVEVMDTDFGVSSTCTIIIETEIKEPVIIKDLELFRLFQNNTYVLRYYAEDQKDAVLNHFISINNGTFNPVTPKLLTYNGEKYYYIIGSFAYKGTFQIAVDCRDSDNYDACTQTISIETMDSIVNRSTLATAKSQYDVARDDLVDYLYSIIEDDKILKEERYENDTRYEMFVCAYDNLYDILEKCVEVINTSVASAQEELSTLATSFVNGEVAAYVIGDDTNSCFETTTDMDYYQNELIKELVARVLSLEALTQELQNKLEDLGE